VDSFTEFVSEVEPRLRSALTSSFGPDIGRDVTAEALAYGWEHWDRVSQMDNPAGYLYVVGRSKGRELSRRTPPILPDSPSHMPWVEPGLPMALTALSEQQRTVIALHHGYEWSLSEVAEVLGLTKATVQNHERRALKKLRRKLGVPHE
jgi:RNA polymerase sigma-70 factor (ECF subfamily)